jgi:hypothetical protein
VGLQAPARRVAGIVLQLCARVKPHSLVAVQRALSGSQRHDGVGHERKPRSSSSTGVQGMVSSRVAAVGRDRRSRPFLHVTMELNEYIV